MKRITAYLFIFISFNFYLISGVKAQDTDKYYQYFQEAYEKYPSVPGGLLEAVAYTRTRMRHLVGTRPSCHDLPQFHSIMGLVEDGKGYFQDNLNTVARLSGFTTGEIKRDPRKAILGYAAAYSSLQRSKRMMNTLVEFQKPIVNDLSEIPQDNTTHNRYAADQEFFSILREMERPHTQARRFRRQFDYEGAFGDQNYKVLSAPSVLIQSQSVTGAGGAEYKVAGENSPRCTSTKSQTDFPGALWVAANPRNYGSRNGEEISHITLHTIQGSYASAISWFKNPMARVSAHYVVRASDGQITQMVCEFDKAYHVRNQNGKTVGIEHEGFVEDGLVWYSREMYESTAILIQNIADRYNIDTKRMFAGPPTNGVRPLSDVCYKIKGHQHFSNNDHHDPGQYWDWDRLYKLINGESSPEKLTANSGDIYDPGGKDKDYGSLQRKTYLIAPEGASSLNLEFKSFDLEGTTNAPFDYLDIYDGKNTNGRYLGRFTGNTLPPVLIANSGTAYLEFRSDCRENKAGFHLRYKVQDADSDCGSPKDLKAGNILPLVATLNWDQSTKADRYRVLVRRKLGEQRWTQYFTSQEEATITGLAAGGLYEWLVQGICGSDTSGMVGGLFETRRISRQGSTPYVMEVQQDQGIFYDSGGKNSPYLPEEEWIYRIIPSAGKQVELNFSQFDTEAEYDKLTIYDGIDKQTLIGIYSGQEGPGKIVSTKGALTMEFISDRRTESTGWQANWRAVDSPADDPDNGPGENPEIPENPITSGLNPVLVYPPSAPETRVEAENAYNSSFTLQFQDQAQANRSLRRFYNVAEKQGNTYRSNPEAGFFYDNFDGLNLDWKSAEGRWQVENGHLRQLEESATNSNIYTFLQQKNSGEYLYHWQGVLSGRNNNRRYGFHFFADNPRLSNRGNSYFIWIREGGNQDFIEIYKTTDNKFSQKLKNQILIEPNKAYDFKVIYNPRSGKIEVFINNTSVAQWTDPAPLQNGLGISFRTGNSQATFDQLRVYKSRGSSASVSVGTNQSSNIRTDGALLSSLVIDNEAQWSRESSATVAVNFDPKSGKPDKKPEPKPENPDPDPTAGGILKSIYRRDFVLNIPPGSFQLLANYDGSRWTTNRNSSTYYDDFEGSRLAQPWLSVAGSWSSGNGTLRQTNKGLSNGILSLPLPQSRQHVYLYQYRIRYLNDDENVRFGLHFFASDGRQANRGESYLAWFRHRKTEKDLVEIYRSTSNDLPLADAAFIDISPTQWHDVKVLCDAPLGVITIYLDGKRVMRWQDPNRFLPGGSFISFRSGNANLEVQQLRVYRQSPDGKLPVSIGNQADDLIQHKSKGGKPAIRLLTIEQDLNGDWGKPSVEEARVE